MRTVSMLATGDRYGEMMKVLILDNYKPRVYDVIRTTNAKFLFNKV